MNHEILVVSQKLEKEKLAELVEVVETTKISLSKVATIKESYFRKPVSEDVEIVDEEPEAVVETSSANGFVTSTRCKTSRN